MMEDTPLLTVEDHVLILVVTPPLFNLVLVRRIWRRFCTCGW